MSNLAVEYTYRYPFASEVFFEKERSRVRLSTYQSESNPYFFESAVAEPAVFAETLLCIGSIVRSHFFERRAGLLDPVVTCGQSRLRFEGFSGCCGVYLQCAFDEGAFLSPLVGRGTTNIDFNEQLIHGLAQMRFAKKVELLVGTNELTLAIDEDRITEKKVRLPLRWLKGFCEVQRYLSNAEHQLTVPAMEALRFIRGLPRSSARGKTMWATSTGNSIRLTSQPASKCVPIVGTDRLRAIEPLVRIAKKPIEVWHAGGVTTWQISLPGCTFMASFSPEIYRGFSGEGQALKSLADRQWQNALDQVRSALKWQGVIEPAAIAGQLNLPVAEVVSALDALATRGLVGFDVSSKAYFHRELPFQSDMVETLQPRLIAARKLIAESAVRLHKQISESESEWLVRGSDVEQLVFLSDSGDRCTCTWYSKHQNDRGPCKHVLAARIQISGEEE